MPANRHWKVDDGSLQPGPDEASCSWKFLKSAVAIKLIVGHIRQMVIEHRIKMISKIGVSGVISR
ncbi:hypothetical protein [Lactobacillus delbrueckii]|uniref:hypothetical protein n=1 Tax=Lactobacillus delbrueckii TaxID=1584 RepID=UPI0020D13391|nr:hypothetical protein [Lactobacillus delbrueckii]